MTYTRDGRTIEAFTQLDDRYADRVLAYERHTGLGFIIQNLFDEKADETWKRMFESIDTMVCVDDLPDEETED